MYGTKNQQNGRLHVIVQVFDDTEGYMRISVELFYLKFLNYFLSKKPLPRKGSLTISSPMFLAAN